MKIVTHLFRLVIPTSNRYAQVASVCVALIDRYWPTHPPIDVLCFEQRPVVGSHVNVISLGKQNEYDWALAMATYLRDVNRDSLVMLTLDDYALFKPVNESAIMVAGEIMANDFSVASYALTWMPITAKRPYEQHADVVEFSDWEYLVNFQAAIWNRRILMGLMSRMEPGTSIWSLEVACSECFRRLYRGCRQIGQHVPDPRNPSQFVDGTNKSGWAFAYHNLMHKGSVDPRHLAFIEAEGFPGLE